jgi:formate-dependent nitrite reductase membrane component NrfD
MLRVFKPQSPMSVGVWTLAAFGGAAAGAALLPWKPMRNLAGLGAAATGLVMATYTGVLLGVSAIPLWKEHAHFLPVHFGASALGSAVSLLELRGHRHSALKSLGIAAATFESAADFALQGSSESLGAAEFLGDRAAEELRGTRGSRGTGELNTPLMQIAGALSGPVPFFLRLFGKRKAAAAATLLGSLMTRVAWVEAGKASANNVSVALHANGA